MASQRSSRRRPYFHAIQQTLIVSVRSLSELLAEELSVKRRFDILKALLNWIEATEELKDFVHEQKLLLVNTLRAPLVSGDMEILNQLALDCGGVDYISSQLVIYLASVMNKG